MDENDNNDEFIWTDAPFSKPPCSTLNTQLQQFEVTSLHCPCCRELYSNAVTLRPCHHSFCSKCIRRHLCANVRNGVRHERVCPMCNVKIEIRKASGGLPKKLDDDDAIIPNYGLQVSSELRWLFTTVSHSSHASNQSPAVTTIQ